MEGRQIHSLLMSRVDYLERIDDPLHVRWTLSFVARAENVKEFVAAVEAMKDSLTRLGAALIFQSLQPLEGNLLERSLHNWLALIAVALRLVPQVGQSRVAVHQPVDNAKSKDAPIFQADRINMGMAVATVIVGGSRGRQRDAKAVVGINVRSPLLFLLLG